MPFYLSIMWYNVILLCKTALPFKNSFLFYTTANSNKDTTIIDITHYHGYDILEIKYIIESLRAKLTI